MKAWFLGLSFVLLISVAYGQGGGRRGRSGKLLDAKASSGVQGMDGVVRRGELIQRVTVSGSVIPKRKGLILAPYAGYVRKLYVKIGDQVKEGDPLVSLAQSIRSNEEIFPLRAPFSGTVVQVQKQEGEYVPTGGADVSTMVRVDDLSRLGIDANAPELEFPKLKIGQEVIVRATAILDRTYKGRIKTISLASKDQSSWDRSRVEFPFTMEVLDQDERLRPGMSVIVDIVAMKLPSALILRHEYIDKNGDDYFVTLDGSGEKRPIKVGLQNEEAFEIVSGLKEGERARPVDFL